MPTLWISFLDPLMRCERYWERRKAQEFPPIDLLLRPIGIKIDGQTLMDVGVDGKSDMIGLVTHVGDSGLGILIGFKTAQIDTERSYKGVLVPDEPLDVTPSCDKLRIPVFRLGALRFIRICERKCLYALIPSRPKAERQKGELKLLGGLGRINKSPGGLLARIPYRKRGVEIVIQEFPDILAVATRQIEEDGTATTRIRTVPYHDWLIGELMERCGSPRIETVAEEQVGRRSLPIMQYLTTPTARLTIAETVRTSPEDPIGPALDRPFEISSASLRSVRLLGFDLAVEFETPPRRGDAAGTLGTRLVLLDQGGAREAIVRTEPRKWRPTIDKTALVVSNDLKFLTMVTNMGSTYHMRSEAVESFQDQEWQSKGRFILNDLLYAGEKPSLAPGDLATFLLETGQPERVRTMMGSMMRVVTKPQVVSVEIFVTHVRETSEDRLYVDGYRSTGSLSAFPVEEMRPVRLIRGGRFRWRPKVIPPEALLRIAKAGQTPFVFEDEAGTINVVVSTLPRRQLVFPRPGRFNIPKDLRFVSSASFSG